MKLLISLFIRVLIILSSSPYLKYSKLGKAEVMGSSPIISSKLKMAKLFQFMHSALEKENKIKEKFFDLIFI